MNVTLKWTSYFMTARISSNFISTFQIQNVTLKRVSEQVNGWQDFEPNSQIKSLNGSPNWHLFSSNLCEIKYEFVKIKLSVKIWKTLNQLDRTRVPKQRPKKDFIVLFYGWMWMCVPMYVCRRAYESSFETYATDKTQRKGAYVYKHV